MLNANSAMQERMVVKTAYDTRNWLYAVLIAVLDGASAVTIVVEEPEEECFVSSLYALGLAHYDEERDCFVLHIRAAMSFTPSRNLRPPGLLDATPRLTLADMKRKFPLLREAKDDLALEVFFRHLSNRAGLPFTEEIAGLPAKFCSGVGEVLETFLPRQ